MPSQQDIARLKASLTAVNAQIQASRAMAAVPPPPAPPPGPGPVMLQQSFVPIQQALKAQADALEKLAKVVGDFLDASK